MSLNYEGDTIQAMLEALSKADDLYDVNELRQQLKVRREQRIEEWCLFA